MDIMLSPIEVRILGSLIEKEITTPDYYPISLNALTNACNQKSNRNPAMSIDEKTVVRKLEGLISKKLVWRVDAALSRVEKYKHNISSIKDFTQQETGLLCELFLRGPQTLGELRTHTARICKFDNLEEVEEVLKTLIDDAEEGPFIQKLPREAGRRERRYAHLLSGEIEVDKLQTSRDTAVIEVQAENKRIEALEQEISLLKEELNNLKEQFYLFKKEFE